MVGEGHFSHGELEIGLVLDPLRDAEGGADQESRAGLAHVLDLFELSGKFLGGEDLSLGGEDAQPGIFGNIYYRRRTNFNRIREGERT